MSFKKWLGKELKKGGFDGDQLDFAADCLRDKKWREPKNWSSLHSYLKARRAIPDAIQTARVVFNRWQTEDPRALVDGMGPREVRAIRAATRKAWSWCYAKRLCVERATGTDGFPRCEKCRTKVPRIAVDHIVPVGKVDSGYLARLFCPSEELQALCKKCHDEKTRDEKREAQGGY